MCSRCGVYVSVLFFFFFKQKTAYDMRISDWSSDVCSSDLPEAAGSGRFGQDEGEYRIEVAGAGRQHEDVPDRVIERQPLPDEEDHAGRIEDAAGQQNGRESCRERVGQDVEISVAEVSLKNKKKKTAKDTNL